MRRAALSIALAAIIALASGAPAASPTPTPCALGSLSSSDARLVRSALAQQQSQFERSLTHVPNAMRGAAGTRFATDLAAWIYGYPIVLVRRTIQTFPPNTLVAIAKLADTSTQTVVAPNHDTLYSVARVDLSGGPVVIQTPPTAGRYSVIQLLDGFTNVPAYLGDGPAARSGETAAVVPPGWHGALPAGIRIARPATRLLWLLGRTLATTASDERAAAALLARYSLTPLAAYLQGTRKASLVLPDFPKGRKPVRVPATATFFDELGADLAAEPAPAADRCALAEFARAGIGPGKEPSKTLAGLSARALSAAAAAGPALVRQFVARLRRERAHTMNGWLVTPRDTGRFATDYFDRAVVAAIGLGANTVEKALYLIARTDVDGRSLRGVNEYRVRFAPGALPPVRQFWSLTLYDQRILFYPNRLNRWAIGNRTAGLRRDRDGGLTIIISHRDPGSRSRSNWLPAPAGPFSLYLRLYEPKPAAYAGAWRPPPVVRVS